MPEYLAPGVFVEETSFRSKSIEGVSTTTTAFVGPARFGPVELQPALVTSLGEFERIYGGGTPLFGRANYVWHAARAFFEEGGKRLYVARIYCGVNGKYEGWTRSEALKSGEELTSTEGYDDGHARCAIGDGGDTSDRLRIVARYPGAVGNFRLRFAVTAGKNILSFSKEGKAKYAGLTHRDIVQIDTTESSGSGSGTGPYYLARWDAATKAWTFTDGNRQTRIPGADDKISILSLQFTVSPVNEPGLPEQAWTLALDDQHESAGAPDSLAARFRWDDDAPARGRDLPIFVVMDKNYDGYDGLRLMRVLEAEHDNGTRSQVGDDEILAFEVLLQGGNDGQTPGSVDYEGEADVTKTTKTGLKALEDLEDISIVAAPGATHGYEEKGDTARAIMGQLIGHAERMRYRIAVLDSGDHQTVSDVRDLRAQFDSKYAALYYPWVRVLDPVTRQPIHLPPSGFVAGIFARNDVERGVYKAPANEVVRLAIGFEAPLNKAQQEVLNPEGINAFRFFEGRGYRLWGARTISSDPEWKYVNLRRYFNYLERSIDKGTQWAVFEPNGEALWANVRRTVEDFLFNEWQMGALLGDKPEKSFFVRCDRSTMTQNDLDNGRLIALVGVAPLRPAEFVIFRIGQKTASA